ncbi:DUF4350 domain-containing protein [Mycolicibacterium sp. F2034L]|uniref:DUF4350 domain-containing protein n=1 Tax=Mycolicibacterium sp. F2034L TaxID=2926422 RepID=UPI001FF354A9|nr:DUF4350 domain-containing protein [Mycolicibacterium sp. F2034L]MCK0176392.1 DUF4350 domain-containing protein [Mycolicibacterium sp. F2034L]
MTAVGPTLAQRWRTARWVVLTLVVLAAVAAAGAYFTTPRDGGPMDPQSTSPEGARALVTLLRDNGVEVIEAGTVADVERAARPDTLVVLAETYRVTDEDHLRRLAAVPGDRLLTEPVSRVREALAPGLRADGATAFAADPGCDLREAERAGAVQFGVAETYRAASDEVALTRCYDGALVRYHDDGRTITVVGAAGFMTNGDLARQGNAALALNLAGAGPRVIWYAPQEREGEATGSATITDLVPEQVSWVVLQLGLVVLLLAVWRGRRLGPLVAEQLPVVVRASETVEGRGRLYRSQRARDRAADALRTAAVQRLIPRLGLGTGAEPWAVVAAVAQRCGGDPTALGHTLFGPPPATEAELVSLAHHLDDIERQVAAT